MVCQCHGGSEVSGTRPPRPRKAVVPDGAKESWFGRYVAAALIVALIVELIIALVAQSRYCQTHPRLSAVHDWTFIPCSIARTLHLGACLFMIMWARAGRGGGLLTMWFVGVALVQISKQRFCQLVGGTLDERGDADHLVHIEAHLYTLSEQLFDLMKKMVSASRR